MGKHSVKRRAVFLDRDGVLNRPIIRDRRPYPPASVEKFQLYDGVADACASLEAAHFLLIVVTNQPDVGRGTQNRATVEAMHRKLRLALPAIDRIEICYHAGERYGQLCDCRKPKPGMILRAAAELDIDLDTSYLIGDRWRDINCAHAANCRAIFIERGYDEALREAPDFTVTSFAEAVNVVLCGSRAEPTFSFAAACWIAANMTYDLIDLPVKVFADGADLQGIVDLYRKPFIKGLTTNPSLMRKVGITDYEAFARAVLEEVRSKPISFEVFSDEFPEMRRQAMRMRDWQENVYVKIPVTNTRGESAVELIRELAGEGVKVNVTALLTAPQVTAVAAALDAQVPAVVSVFAGRVADTGVDPVPLMKESLEILRDLPRVELLWASVREVFNVYQAAACGCHIVTVPHDILKKLMQLGGKDLEELSLDTVRMFHQDAVAAGFKL
jgi:transaldolase